MVETKQPSINPEHKALLHWYEQNARDALPWRNTNNIYHIYLSEVMLQQTQASRVASEYYPRFLKRFPTLSHLASASLEDVLALWSGLGYYRRAKHLHQTAKLCKSGLPKSESELRKLPGIGRYIASAVASFGYEYATPVVDTNIARVIKRYFALMEPKESEIWHHALQLLNHTSPKKHNLALMDLGSMVCTPLDPKCSACPLITWCQGASNPHAYSKSKKKEYIAMELFLGICIKDDKLALVPSQSNMYQHMLELPNIDPIEDDFIGTFKHSYTKYRLTIKLFHTSSIPHEDITWVLLDSLESLPISSLTKKAIKAINTHNIV
jgi:A/G-specific adenine glycosylase